MHRVQLYTGFTHGHDRGQRRLDHEPSRHAGPARGQGLAGDQAGARRRPGAERNSPKKRPTSSRRGWNTARAASASKGRRNRARRSSTPAWTPIAEAVLGPVLGEELLNEFAVLNGRSTTRPPRSGSAYGGGWYGYVYKDLRTELGLPVQRPTVASYCGNGNLEALPRPRCGRRSRARSNSSRQLRGPNPPAGGRRRCRIAFAPGLLPVHDELDEPFDLPAGDRIHRTRRIGR